MKDTANLIKQHHKRCDGKGYHSVYKGEKIELVARIMAAAKGKFGYATLSLTLSPVSLKPFNFLLIKIIKLLLKRNETICYYTNV